MFHTGLDRYLTADVLKIIKEYCIGKLEDAYVPVLFKVYDDALPVAASGKLNVEQMQKVCDEIIEIL